MNSAAAAVNNQKNIAGNIISNTAAGRVTQANNSRRKLTNSSDHDIPTNTISRSQDNNFIK